jgi:hypothetical protein
MAESEGQPTVDSDGAAVDVGGEVRDEERDQRAPISSSAFLSWVSVRALGGERLGDRQAEALRGGGDPRGAVGKIQLHVTSHHVLTAVPFTEIAISIATGRECS